MKNPAADGSRDRQPDELPTYESGDDFDFGVAIRDPRIRRSLAKVFGLLAFTAGFVSSVGPELRRQIEGSVVREVAMDTTGPMSTQGEYRTNGWEPTFNPVHFSEPGKGISSDPTTQAQVTVTRTLDPAGQPIGVFRVEVTAASSGEIEVVRNVRVLIDGIPQASIESGGFDATNPQGGAPTRGNPTGREAKDLAWASAALPTDTRTHRLEVTFDSGSDTLTALTANIRSGHLTGFNPDVVSLQGLAGRANTSLPGIG